jgi:hypothetical protein
MRKRLVPLSAAAMVLVSTASADPFVDAVVRNFQDLGYEFIEIDRGRTQLRAEGVRGSEELTVIYDLATGSIIRQERGRADDWYIGRSGIEINSRDRDFVGDSRSGCGRDDFDDDDDDDDRSRGRDDFDDDDDDDDRSFSGSDSGFGSGSGRDDNDDDNDDDDDDD